MCLHNHQRLNSIDKKERKKNYTEEGVRKINHLSDNTEIEVKHYETYFFEKRLPKKLQTISKDLNYSGTMEPADMFAEFVSRCLKNNLNWNVE